MALASSGDISIHNAGGTSRSIRYEIFNSYATEDLTDLNSSKNSGSATSGWNSVYDYLGYNHLHPPTMGLVSWADPDMTVNFTDTNTSETGYNFERKLNTGSWSSLGNWTGGSPFSDDPTCGASNTYYYRARAYITSTINQAGDFSSQSTGKLAVCCLLSGHKLQIKPNVYKKIEEVQKGDLMYTGHHRDANDISYFEVSKAESHPVNFYYVVLFADGSKVRCSPTHVFIIGRDERRRVTRLAVGDTVMQYKDGTYRDQTITKILRIQSPETVFKITVECGHTYITEDGIFHHNEK